MSGQSKFNDFFSKIYGERWPSIQDSLKQPEVKVRRLCFPTLHLDQLPDSCIQSDWGQYLYQFTAGDTQIRGTDRLNLFYVLDPASVIVARQFDLSCCSTILDMCSAPGGKGIILAEQMNGDAELLLNEFSRDRRDRLVNVVRDHVPNNVRNQVFVKGKDGIRYGQTMPGYFDAILVDAPCSGEKHLVGSTTELDKWSEKRTKRLSGKQYGLLCSALLAAKPGAQIIYSTCSISPYENDGVIEKLLAKKGEHFELISNKVEVLGSEKTKYGHQFLPDKAGIGPMYFTKLIKK